MNKVPQPYPIYFDSIEHWALMDQFTVVCTMLEEVFDSLVELAALPPNSHVRQQLVGEVENIYIVYRKLDRMLGIKRACRCCQGKKVEGAKDE